MPHKTIQELAQGLATHLREAAPTVADLPDEATLTSFLLEGMRYQLGAACTHVEPLHANGALLIPVGETAPMSQDVMKRELLSPKGAMSEQVGGSHYKGMKIQHAEFCQANGLPWCESAAIKYLCRHKSKNKLEDLRKAIHYIRLCAQLEYGEQI